MHHKAFFAETRVIRGLDIGKREIEKGKRERGVVVRTEDFDAEF